MEPLMAVTIGVLFATAIYMMLRRSIVKLVIGLMLLSNAANLLIFATAGMRRGAPPLVPEGLAAPESAVADPLPQALVLTAIVIGFAMTAFAVILAMRARGDMGNDHVDGGRNRDDREENRR